MGKKTSINFHETTFTCFIMRAVTPFMKKGTQHWITLHISITLCLTDISFGKLNWHEKSYHHPSEIIRLTVVVKKSISYGIT
jgi:hypothetical protein